ncbi:sensor histidine kinase [Nocardia aurantia]|uniref:histidine kinase n=1 Tax=Nocardia aurantia TaxID=2585199 RepID=A0A7K0DYC7_9NOCA|nr:CHASE3 domain-containing protein [Nocardia aurantia]MQY30810.1 Adaptive-response sensory-kinase SasA [Nocardia aurantia]
MHSDIQTPPRWWRRITVQGWFVLVVGLMALLVVVGTGVGAGLLAHTARVSDQLVQRIQPARTESYRMQAALIDQETGVRGYTLVADKQFLEPYDQGRRDEAAAAGRLRELLAGRPELIADLDAAEAAAAAWQREYAEPVVAGVTPGAPRGQNRANADAGKVAFDRLRTVWASLDGDLSRAAADGRGELSRVRTVRDVVLGGLVVVFLLAGLALVVLVRVLVTRPMSGLRAASRRVADGDYEHRIPVRGPADLSAVAQDVEDMRRRIVAALADSRRQGAELARQARELDARTIELQRSNNELEQFAYVASHDLQEPLRKVASFCQMLEKRYSEVIDDRGRQYIHYAVDGAKRMQTLINDLLAFSRVGRVHDDREPVALSPVVDAAVGNLAAAIEETGARVDYPADLPEVIGDRVLLGMLWQNLLGNSMKFHRPDSPPVITVTAARAESPDEPAMWRFAVTDNGIGIPAEFADKVFVIFQRLHNRDAYTGTGVGLALCRKIVEQHGGEIHVDTGFTDGTRIVFTLPAAGTDDSIDSGEPAAATEGAVQ